MINFTFNCTNLSKEAPKTDENRVLFNQLLRAASSIGANYTEANNAVSRLDFRNKIYTSKKEAAETRYWLRLIAKVNPNLSVNDLIDECSQFNLILQKSVTTLKNGS